MPSDEHDQLPAGRNRRFATKFIFGSVSGRRGFDSFTEEALDALMNETNSPAPEDTTNTNTNSNSTRTSRERTASAAASVSSSSASSESPTIETRERRPSHKPPLPSPHRKPSIAHHLQHNNTTSVGSPSSQSPSSPASPSPVPATASGSSSLPPTYKQELKIFDPLIKLIISEEGVGIILRICCESNKDIRDEMLRCLIPILRYQKSSMSVMKKVISHELSNNGEDGYRLLHAYNRMYFTQYLANTLRGPLNSIRQQIYEASLLKDMNEWYKKIMEMTDSLISAINSSADLMPAHLKDICNFLYTKSGNVKAVGRLVFRHFLVPAIVFPENYDLWTKNIPTTNESATTSSPTTAQQELSIPSASERKILVEISKLMQKIPEGFVYVSTLTEAQYYNSFIITQQLELNKFLMTISKPVHLNGEGEASAIDVRRGTLQVVSEGQYYESLNNFYEFLIHIFAYFPVPNDIPEASYIHIIRTEEVMKQLQAIKSREDFLNLLEKVGTIIVPIEWINHRKGVMLTDMNDTYRKITEKQINADLQRDKLIINNQFVFENANSQDVIAKLEELLLKYKVEKDKESARQTALQVLQTCGRTSSAGDGYDVIHHVLSSAHHMYDIIAETNMSMSSEAQDLQTPVVITIEQGIVKSQQMNCFKIMDQYFDEKTSVWCRVRVTTKWQFFSNQSERQHSNFGIVILEPVGVSAVERPQLIKLQRALYEIHNHRKSLTGISSKKPDLLAPKKQTNTKKQTTSSTPASPAATTTAPTNPPTNSVRVSEHLFSELVRQGLVKK